MFQNKYVKTLIKYLKNKYIITILIFLIWLMFFDSNNLLSRFKELNRLRELEKSKIYYKERIDVTRARMKELRTDERNLEKFAREQYQMKKMNEDIFIVVEE